ncbi:TB2/DP1, HVA22 family-domain-containing protein [Phlebopus sp. FC_14]|nr:TB2/DP1, HVA22 family-domain-containing protein [Phlebopus sp. FC_14]
MLFYLTSCVVSSVVAFLYPGYASYKTLSQRPASEDDIERWLMYWSVLGCIVAFEYVAEWLVSWLPMYYVLKTLFLFYLVLPQTRGSSYLYINHLQPFFHSHESQIDATLASFKARIYSFIQERFRAIWEQLVGALGQQQQSQREAPFMPSGVGVATHTGAPPTLGDPASGPAQLVMGLWRSYGPSIMASGVALLSQGVSATEGTTGQGWQAPADSPPRHPGAGHQESRRDRSVPVPTASGSVQISSRNSSDSELRGRGGRFEEVDVPSDAEGYDVGGGGGAKGSGGEEQAGRPTSWFGWGSAAGSRAKAE